MGPERDRNGATARQLSDSDATRTTAIQIIRGFLAGGEVPGRVKDAWKHVENAFLQSSVPEAYQTREALETIRKDVAHIKALFREQQSEPKKPTTYAEAARARGGAGGGYNAPREATQPARYQREVVVAPGGETPEQKLRSGKELVESLNKYAGGDTAVAARRLPSGDVLVTTVDTEGRKTMQQNTDWLKAFGVGARIKRKAYTVLVHGIKVAQVNTLRQEESIRKIYEQNPKLQGQVEILRVSWTKRTISNKKAVAPLLVSVAEAEQGNYLIDSGVIWDYQLHDCEPFTGDCNITQCFKCYNYGHTAKTCGNRAKCGFCAAPGHETNDCMQKHNPENHRCAVCASAEAKHPAWAGCCPKRKQKVAETRLAYSQRPTRFQVRMEVRTPATIAEANVGAPVITRDTTPPLSTTTPSATPPESLRDSTGELQKMTGVTHSVLKTGEKRSARALEVSDDDEDSNVESTFTEVVRRGRPRWNATAPQGSQSIYKLLTATPSQAHE